MRNSRILITGGAGLVGSHIADQAVKVGAREIVIFDNFARGRRENLACALAHGPVTVVEGDIRDQGLLTEVMQGIDVVFHQAAIRITQCAEEPRLGLEVLCDGTFNVLEAAVKTRVKKIVAASSASVYGLAEEFPTPEHHHPYKNCTFYGAAKAFNEGLLRSFHDVYGLDYIALRYSMCMAHGWIVMVRTPRCSSDGWNVSLQANRRSFSVTGPRLWTLSILRTWPEPIYWPLAPM